MLSIFVLDILGEIGGGRGEPLNVLARYTLGVIIWGLMLVGAFSVRRGSVLLRDKLLIAGFVIGFSRELFMLSVSMLGLRDIVSAETLSLFLPPIDNMSMLVARAVIAAAFLHYFVRPSAVSRNFFIITVSVCFVMYFVIAIDWWYTVVDNPTLQFEKHWSILFVHLFGAVFVLVSILFILQQTSGIRIFVAIAFTMYLGNHLLVLLNLYMGQTHPYILLPIANNLDLWATPIIGFVYWREQREHNAQLQAEIKQTERLELIGQLSAGVSHDFKNHLQVIRGYAELAQIQQSHPEKVEECLVEISDTVDRSVALVNQLLAFSRSDDAKKDVAVNLNDVIADLTPMLSQLLGQQYQLKFHLDANAPTARFDVTEFEQVIVNLVVNARDAMLDGGEITFTTRNIYSAKKRAGSDGSKPSVEEVQLVVSDSGVGMSQKTLQRAFEPFYTTKAVGEGTGLGLSTVYGLVQQHAGKIAIQSKLNKGTSVTVTLRPAKLSVDATRPVDRGDVLGGSECILIAEDDNSVRNLVYELLTKAGYTVYQAIDGHQAQTLARVHANSIDLLLFDVAMPKMNGYLAYEAIAPLIPSVKVAFVSADTSRVKGFRASYPHLAKPFSHTQLLRYVREQLT